MLLEADQDGGGDLLPLRPDAAAHAAVAPKPARAPTSAAGRWSSAARPCRRGSPGRPSRAASTSSAATACPRPARSSPWRSSRLRCCEGDAERADRGPHQDRAADTAGGSARRRSRDERRAARRPEHGRGRGAGALADARATSRIRRLPRLLWQGGYLHTNDVGHIDPAGYLQITDRIKDVIKTGGEWISSLQIEDLDLAAPRRGRGGRDRRAGREMGRASARDRRAQERPGRQR